MVLRHLRATIEVGDRAGDAKHAMNATGGELELLPDVFERTSGALTQGTDVEQLLASEAGVRDATVSLERVLPGPEDALPHLVARLRPVKLHDLVGAQSRHGHPQVDTVE